MEGASAHLAKLTFCFMVFVSFLCFFSLSYLICFISVTATWEGEASLSREVTVQSKPNFKNIVSKYALFTLVLSNLTGRNKSCKARSCQSFLSLP